MTQWRNIITEAALAVLGLAPILKAEQCPDPPGPLWCPPLNCPDYFLTPTLLDWLCGAGFTAG